jgi:mono/diheme cytochrome c family protein
VLIALTIAGGAAPGALTGSITSGPVGGLPGAQQITQAGCATCHTFPNGGGQIGSSLAHGSGMFGTDQAALQVWIAHGAHDKGTGMPAFDQSFNKQQIAEIAQVIASLKTNSVQPLGGS